MKIFLLAALVSAALAPAAWADIKRTTDGKPELSGNYNTATLTPLERPTSFGDNLYLTREEAESIVNVEKALQAEGDKQLDPNREAPSEGGDGSTGNVGVRELGFQKLHVDAAEVQCDDRRAIEGFGRSGDGAQDVAVKCKRIFEIADGDPDVCYSGAG